MHRYLDLNNDGAINEDVADVYTHTKDANPDKDGWRNHLKLPWSKRISGSMAYLGDKSLYDEYTSREMRVKHSRSRHHDKGHKHKNRHSHK